MLSPQIRIGPVNLHLYGLIIALAVYIGYLIAQKRAHIYKINPKIFDDPLMLAPFILSIAGARLYHVIDYWAKYNKDPESIFFVQNGGLGIFGALFGAIAGFYLLAKIKKAIFFNILDLVSPSFLLAQAIGRFGNYINQEGFGPPTSLPWGVYIAQQNRPFQFQTFSHFHPTFFYEAIIDFIFFLILLYLSSKLKIRGQVFALYLILYSLGRFIVEFWRIDTATIGTIKVAHVLTAATFCFGALFFLKARHNKI